MAALSPARKARRLTSGVRGSGGAGNSNLLFALIARRWERSSIIVTSNRSFEAWGRILSDAMIAAALIDRLIHRATIVSLKGKSYRLRERAIAGSRATRSKAPQTEP